jgi:hypothetical protein
MKQVRGPLQLQPEFSQSFPSGQVNVKVSAVLNYASRLVIRII